MVYLIKENKIIQTYENVISFDRGFVEYSTGNIRTKQYCSAEEYFTDTPPQNIEEEIVTEETIKEETNGTI